MLQSLPAALTPLSSPVATRGTDTSPWGCAGPSPRQDETAPVNPIGTDDLRPATDRNRCRILWIDDELPPDDPLLRLLALEGFQTDLARLGAEGLAKANARTYDAIILDLRLPDLFGLTVLHRLVAREVPVLVATGYYFEPEVEADAMRAGAAAFRHKPFIGTEDLTLVLHAIIAGSRPSGMRGPSVPPSAGWRFGIVAVSQAMRAIVEWIDRVAPTRATVLITGETGTGKELVASALHCSSLRSSDRFFPVNCAAIPENLVETELFGHRKGAFTGAVSDKEGVFEAAHGGTLFLDEIGDLPPPLQGRLLRCLDSGEVRRVGDTKTRRVDVRVIAATNRSLRDDVEHGRFRVDLFYRLAVAHVHIPPLRERIEDIEALAKYWLSAMSQRRTGVVGTTPGALDTLRAHCWPGNVRELRNVLERAAWVASGNLLTEGDVSAALSDGVGSTPSQPVAGGSSEEFRKAISALDAHHWNHTQAARSLGISRITLWRMLRRGGLDRRGSGP